MVIMKKRLASCIQLVGDDDNDTTTMFFFLYRLFVHDGAKANGWLFWVNWEKW